MTTPERREKSRRRSLGRVEWQIDIFGRCVPARREAPPFRRFWQPVEQYRLEPCRETPFNL